MFHGAWACFKLVAASKVVKHVDACALSLNLCQRLWLQSRLGLAVLHPSLKFPPVVCGLLHRCVWFHCTPCEDPWHASRCGCWR